MNSPAFQSDQLLIDLPPLPSADPDVETDPNWDLSQLAKTYRTRIYEILDQHQADGSSGRTVVQLHTALMDQLVTYLFMAATRLYARRYPSLSQRCSVFAQGGYGRRELSPHSDIDLLFLYHWKITPYAETVWETIYYSLVDAGWTVGHAVRNMRECLRLAAKDLEIKTALLDSRYLCGEESLAQEFQSAITRELMGKRTEQFFQAKARESQTRHQRYGASLYLLEPNLKEGCGGLRDLHTAWWLAKVKFKLQNLRELVTKGIVPESTLEEVETAQDFLWRVRNGLHLLDRTEQDQLTFEHQDQLASALGYTDTIGFMRMYYQHATTVYDFAQLMFERCLSTARLFNFLGRPRGRDIRDGVRIVENTLHITKVEILTQEPLNVVTIFHDAQRHGVLCTRETKQFIRTALTQIPPDTASQPALRDAFFTILAWKQRVAPTIREMHEARVLEWLLPEFGHLRWRTQRDLYHIYAIDEHTLHAVAELERLRDGDYKEDMPLLTQVMREIDRVDLLFLSILFHDVGKGYGVEHAARSAEMVETAATRWQLSRDDAHEWEVLVCHHLFMSHIAQRRDLSDDTLIAEFARTVENSGCLKRLYLLTFADMKAVGPKVWNSWKGGLLSELYLRTLERLETGELIEEEQGARVQRRKERLRQTLVAEVDPEQVDGFLTAMPDSYFLTTPEESVPEHFQLMSRFSQAGLEVLDDPYRVSLNHFPEQEYSELALVTRDRPGLFAMLAGVLAVSGLSVAGARITTSQQGIALDVFRLSHLDRQDVVLSPDTWARFYPRLGDVLRGERTVEELLQAARPPAFLKRLRPHLQTEVTIDNTTSSTYTLVDITAPDRTGLLFSVTYALFQFGLVIHLAKITTNVDQVLDVFYVTDVTGAKVGDPERLTEALYSRLINDEEAA